MYSTRKTLIVATVFAVSSAAMVAGSFASLPAAAARVATQAKPKLEIVSVGFSAAPVQEDSNPDAPAFWWTAGAIVHNPSDQAAYYVEPTFVLKGANGKVVARSRPHMVKTWILPGRDAYLVASEELGEGASAEPVEVQLRLKGGELIPAESLPESHSTVAALGTADSEQVFTITDARYHSFQRGLTSELGSDRTGVVHATVTNTTGTTLVGGTVDCVLLEQGEVVGGATGTLGVSPPGTPVGFDAAVDVGDIPHDELQCEADLGSAAPDAGVPLTAEVVELPDDADTGDHTYAVTVTNSGEVTAEEAVVDVQLLDATGRPVGQGLPTEHLTQVPGSQMFYVALVLGEVPDAPVASTVVRVGSRAALSATEFEQRYGYAPHALSLTAVELGEEGLSVTGTVRNPSSVTLDLFVGCIISSGGQPVSIAPTQVFGASRGKHPFDAPAQLGTAGVADDARCTAAPAAPLGPNP